MSRWMGWMLAVGVGGALMAGCRSEESRQAGRFNEPIHQKYQTPAASEAQSGQGGSGGAGTGVALDKGWQDHPANEDINQDSKRGPYVIDRPQEVPRERQPGPFGVGSGTDSARRMAQEQLKE
ncbi:hypothetical protein [Cystobacter ferrugineus]|nr:hypothetical protein [Cystobacter ferrugineus]